MLFLKAIALFSSDVVKLKKKQTKQNKKNISFPFVVSV